MPNYKKISKKERRIIMKYLKIHNETEKELQNKRVLPEDYKGYNGVTMIRYGFMNIKIIEANKI